MRISYLTLIAIGLVGFAAEADAQYYASSPYARGPYRAELVDADGTNSPVYGQTPGSMPRTSASRAYESQPLPPPGTTYPPPPASQASQPPTAGQPQSLQPPATAYPSAATPQQPSYGQPQPPAYAPPRETTAYPGGAPGTRPGGTGGGYGFAPLRPPGEIGASATPSYAPAPPPGYVPAPGEGPTGSISASRAPAAAPNGNSSSYASLPADYRPEQGAPKPLPPKFQRQIVDYVTKEPAGTLVVDTPNTFLYLVLGDGKALRYGIGVGREGFTWSGMERVTKMAEWPDWHPPKEMIERQPYLPRFMAGGESSPLGARALYLGKTIYRIHGTNQPSTIGTFVSSGCIRLTNDDVQDLYQRVQVGTRVVVLPKNSSTSATNGTNAAPNRADLPNHSQVVR